MRGKNILLGSLPSLLAAAVVACATRQTVPPGTAVAFVGVNVVPMDAERVLPDQTVVVRDGRIVALGPVATVRVPEDAHRLEGHGKYLLPAIAEMHAHIPAAQTDAPLPERLVERTLLLFGAQGIGTIRGVLGHPGHLHYRERVERGELVGPRIYAAGPSLNGNTVQTKEAAVAAVIAQNAAGYDLLKIHPGLKRDVFDAMAAKAHELRMPFVGHVPFEVGLQRALEARYRSIEHMDGYVEALTQKPSPSQFFGLELIDQVDESRIPALVQATKAAGTWIVPTQSLFDSLLSDEAPQEMAKRPEIRYAEPPGEVEKWIALKNTMLAIPAAPRQKFLQLRRKLIKALFDGGVPFALGSDAPQWWNVPGFSSHRELQSLVAAGLTPYQALRTGTVNVGAYFGTPDVGVVAAGNRADLMLLDANPLAEITNSSRIAGVMLKGRWFSKTELDALLAAAP